MRPVVKLFVLICVIEGFEKTKKAQYTHNWEYRA